MSSWKYGNGGKRERERERERERVAWPKNYTDKKRKNGEKKFARHELNHVSDVIEA